MSSEDEMMTDENKRRKFRMTTGNNIFTHFETGIAAAFAYMHIGTFAH